MIGIILSLLELLLLFYSNLSIFALISQNRMWWNSCITLKEELLVTLHLINSCLNFLWLLLLESVLRLPALVFSPFVETKNNSFIAVQLTACMIQYVIVCNIGTDYKEIYDLHKWLWLSWLSLKCVFWIIFSTILSQCFGKTIHRNFTEVLELLVLGSFTGIFQVNLSLTPMIVLSKFSKSLILYI